MASACALAIFSGKIIFYFGIPERLRTLRYSLFTEGVVKDNGIAPPPVKKFSDGPAGRDAVPRHDLSREKGRNGKPAGFPFLQ